MYEEHFGLKSRPFGAKAEGAGVFVGPQQAKIMNSLTKGLGAADAVVTVTGPVGVGKTTIVSRALESISPGRMVAWVGRMQLAPDEVLELLLTGFGVSRDARGTVQRFSAFRRLLAERAATGAQVAIVVEDAQRIGADALIELEALTAADAGDSTSANIILMGQSGLNKLLATPELARVRQRNRLRQTIEAFNEAEVNGYLKHCIREAGGDYDAIFDSGVASIVYKCSEGVPRIINTLCETAMTTAMEDGQPRVTNAMMQKVAADAFGFEATQTNPVSQIDSEALLAPDLLPEAPTEDVVVAANPAPIETGSDDIPELIEDTHPALEQIDAASEAKEVEVADVEVEATQTQKTLSVPEIDDNNAAAGNADDEADFSLDAALSVEAEETNVMPGITPNLDQLAAEAKKNEEAEKTPTPTATPTENIPTLSNSMRIDVEVEVQRAKDANPDPAPVSGNASKIEATAPVSAPADAKSANIAEAPVPAEAPDNFVLEPADVIPPPPESVPAVAVSPEPEVVVQPQAEPSAPVAAETRPATGEVPAPKADVAVDVQPVSTPVATADVRPAVEVQPDQVPVATPTSQPDPLPAVAAEEKQAPVIDPDPAPKPKEKVTDDVGSTSEQGHESTVGDVAAELAEQAADAWSNFDDDVSDASDSVEEVDVASGTLTLAEEELPAAPESVKGRANAGTPAAKIGTKKEKREPDIDALEAALTAAKKGDFAAQPGSQASSPAEPANPPAADIDLAKAAVDVPEITLEDSLPEPKKDDVELRRVAEQIGAANSLEDVNDVMAETIFGSQALDEIAAAVVANPPSADADSPVMLTDIENPAAANDPDDGVAPKKPAAPGAKPGKLDESAARRLNMVKAMNNEQGKAAPASVEEIEMSSGKPNGAPAAKVPGPQPEPIENQINTSMTQTLKALSSAQIQKAQEPEEEEKKSGGLFSRFRRSS